MQHVGHTRELESCVGSVLKAMVYQFTPTAYHVWSALTTSTTGSSILQWPTSH